MGSATFSHQNELTPNIIARRAEVAAWFRSPWAGMVSDIIVKREDVIAGNAMPIGAMTPIVKMFTEFQQEGSDTVFVPQVRRLTGTPKYGDEVLLGFEENMALYRHPVYVNRLRRAVNTTIGKMNDLRGKKLAMALQAEPVLREFLSDWLTWYGITLAFYEGFSWHISRTAATSVDTGLAVVNGGLNKGRRHHPNFFVADQGWTTWSATHTTYDDSLATALGTLDAAVTDARKMSSSLLEGLKSELIKKRIQPRLTKNGKPFWDLWVHPDVMAQARQDSRIESATESAWRGNLLDDPMINGAELWYNGFCIRENILIGTEVHRDTDGGILANHGWNVRYGPMNAAETQELDALNNYQSADADDRNLKVSLVVGNNALSVGQTQRAEMFNEETDYSNKKSVDIDLIFGAARNDWWDSIGSPTAVENTSSCVIATNSPSLV